MLHSNLAHGSFFKSIVHLSCNLFMNNFNQLCSQLLLLIHSFCDIKRRRYQYARSPAGAIFTPPTSYHIPACTYGVVPNKT